MSLFRQKTAEITEVELCTHRALSPSDTSAHVMEGFCLVFFYILGLKSRKSSALTTVGAPPPLSALHQTPGTKPHAWFCRDVNGYLTLSWRLISVEPPDQIDFTSSTLTHSHTHTHTLTHYHTLSHTLPGPVVKAADTTLLSADSPVHISRSAVRPSHPVRKSCIPPPTTTLAPILPPSLRSQESAL